MIRRMIIGFVLVLMLSLSGPSFAAETAAPAQFTTEADAQAHCPGDLVVWLNVPTGVYHFKGQRWYGATKHGAFVCQKEADAAGDRGTRNGQ